MATDEVHQLAPLPSGDKVALLTNPNYPYTEPRKRGLLEAARISGHEILVLSARDERGIGDAFKELEDRRVDAMLVMADPFMSESEPKRS